MLHARTAVHIVLALILGVGCADDEAVPSELASGFVTRKAVDEDVRAIIDEVNARHVEAFNRGDVETMVQVYSEDAIIYPPDAEAIQGREAILAFWTAGREQHGMRDLRLMTDETDRLGERLAYEAGRARFTTHEGPASLKYLLIWKKDADGKWRWHRNIWNRSPVPAGDG